MRPGIACAVVVGAALLAQAAPAAAAKLCVPNNQIPACNGSGGNENTITNAVTNGHSGDTILIGAGTYGESVDDTGKSYTFIGAGPTKTIIQGAGSPAVNISAGSSISSLTINLHNGPGNAGLMLAGTATNVAITATGPSSTMNNIGVDLNGGTFAHGSVTLPVSGGDVANYGGVIGSGTLSDSSVTAAVGITSDSGGGIPLVHRVRVLANQGVVVGPLSFTIDNSVIRTKPGAATELGIGLAPSLLAGTFTARHVDVVGSGSAGSAGVAAASSGLLFPAHTNVLVDSSVTRGYSSSITALATGAGNPAVTTIDLKYSFYESANAYGLTGGTATIVPDAHSGNFDPLFLNAATGDFHLQAGSRAIDGGDPAPLAIGESSTDLDGHARAIAGHNGDAAISDVGAFEFQPHGPTVRASESAARAAGGTAVRFSASGSDPSPGDSVSFRWRFDDGGSASGATVSHAFVKAGRHTATVTATDLDGFTATASETITVTGPSISKLAIKPKRLRAGHRATISYSDSQAAKTTFKLFRVGSRHAIRIFRHHDRAGKNRLHLRAGTLAPGRYRLVATPRDNAGTGSAVTVRFRIIA